MFARPNPNPSRCALYLFGSLLLGGCQVQASPAEAGPISEDEPPASQFERTDTIPSPAAAPWRGPLLAVERFEDGDFGARGWYDSPGGRLEPDVPPGWEDGNVFVCRFPEGARVCADGTPGRLAFPGGEALFFSYWIRYDEGWVGSGRPYHPHEFQFLTNADGPFVGPARTHLTFYVEQHDGVPLLGLQDSRNVNPACVLRNDDSVVGCDGGGVEDFPFGEDRSVAACNGLEGEVDGRDCFSTGEDRWYSSRSWMAPRAVFREAGPAESGGWRLVETAVVLNSLIEGKGVPDGRIRLWVDGELLIASDRILFRTGRHPDLRFEHLLVAPYIGDGSPVDQTLRIAALLVAQARVPE